jgi:phosphatidylinositol alpha-1,6-mannosyltransferase
LSGEPVRVLLLFATIHGNGGIQRFNRMLMAAVENLNVSCDVFSLYETATGVSRGAGKSGVTLRVFAGSKLRYALAVARAIRFGRYDHVVAGHVNLLVMLAAALSLCPFKMPRGWLVGHGIEVWSGIGALRRVAMRRLWGILSVSRYTQQKIREQAPELPTERFVLFPLALSDTWTASHVRPEASGVTTDLPERFLLSVTRLDSQERYKGILTVLETLGMTADQGIQYLIAGTGDDQAFLLRAARDFGVADRVRFLGVVTDSDLAELYRRSLAFILPSAKEGFGLVFLEAMFFGAPVIAAGEKGALDVIRDEETGLLVRYGDVVALIKAINRLAADNSLRERLRTQARKAVMGDGVFTFGAFVSRLAAVLGAPVRVGNSSGREPRAC